MRSAPSWLLVGVVASLACAPTVPVSSAKPATPAPGHDEFAPTPFTESEIRNATALGRSWEYRVEKPAEPLRRRVMTFVRVTDTDSDIETTLLDDAGSVVKPASVMHATWAELMSHAQFPRAAVTIGEERITVPAGSFDCLRYAVVGKDAEVSTFYFARSLPGPPVLYFSEQGGKRLTTSTLVRYVAGR